MKIAGIITEYNPFHNGHIYHINKTKELTDCDLLICVCTGNFNQRGDLSIINKFEKTKYALDNGVDLVVELPYINTVQNGYEFGKKAIEILNKLNCDYLVFGSETNNIDELKKYSELEVDVTRLKELLHDGKSFPKAYGLLSGSMYPNDILAVTYLKALKGSKIKPISIQRTNDYHGEELKDIASASAIRKAILNGIDTKEYSPVIFNEPIFNKMLYPYLRNILLTSDKDKLKSIALVSEGIENMLVKNALKYSNYDEFIDNCISRRYTRSRIQRVLCHIALNITKDDLKVNNDYIRILGFNDKGKEYLNQIKKDENLHLVTQFKNIPERSKEIEWKASIIYSSLLKDSNDYLKKELKGPIIK